MSDLIRRDEAIKAIKKRMGNKPLPPTEIYTYFGCIDAIKELPSAEAVQGWIPCSERVPSKADHRNDMVLVCYGNGSIRFNTYMNGWVQGFPIAWMPLPTPYKGGDSE